MPTKEHLALDSLTDEALNDKWIRTFERLSLLKAANTWKISNEEAKANFEEIEILSDLFDRIQQEQSERGKNTETPEARRERIRARVSEEKAKGTKAFLRVVADEEGISLTRIKQLVKDDAPLEDDGLKNSPWAGLATNTKQTSSKKTKPK